MVYIISLHRAAGGILPGHRNYVNRHILSPDFSHALCVRLSVKKFSPRQYIYAYMYLLYTYMYAITYYIYIYIHTHTHANAHTLCPSSGFCPCHSSALRCLPFLCPFLFVLPVSFLWLASFPIRSPLPILSAFQSHAKPRYFSPCVSLGFLFLLAVSLAWGCGKVFEMLARSFLKVYGFVFVCRKFYINEKFYVNKHLPKAKIYIDV